MLYHVVSSEVPSSAVVNCGSATAANGQPLAFSVGQSVMVNDATVTMADVATSNGVIHVIDKVLTPTDSPRDIVSTAQCTGAHTSLVAALAQAELVSTMEGDGPFTVFAPTDQAFADAGIDLASLDTPEGKQTLTDILLYHVVMANVPSTDVLECGSATAANGQPLAFTVGSSVMVNDATVTLADVIASNGVIHVVDKVLMPSAAPNDTVRTATCTGVHTSLVAALIQAELVSTLEGEGPFTVFAPTDAAFTAAGIDLATLDTPEGKAALSDILLYHVYAGSITTADITEGQILMMANGDNATLSLSTGINGAAITSSDVFTSNGVIHVIDTVLTPPVEVIDVDDDDEDDVNEGEGSEDDASSAKDEDEDDGFMTYVYIGLVILVLAGVGGLLYMRRGESGGDLAKEYTQGNIINDLPLMSSSTIFTAQPTSTQSTATSFATQTIAAEPAAQTQPVAAMPVSQPLPVQPVAVEPQVLNQWTDEAGHTWRKMDDGSTLWWNGTDWQKYA